MSPVYPKAYGRPAQDAQDAQNSESDYIPRPESFSYQDLRGESAWQSFTATTVNFAFIGAPTYTGRFYVVGRECHVQIAITPGTSMSTYTASSYVPVPIGPVGISGLITAVEGDGIASGASRIVGGLSVSTSSFRFGGANWTSTMRIYAIYEI